MQFVSKTKSFLLALLIIIGLIFFNLPSVSSEIKNFFYSTSSPIQMSFNQFTKQVKSSWDFLNSLKDISEKNFYLEERIKELKAQNVKFGEFEKENEFLRSYLKLPVFQRYQIDLANIISQDFQGIEKYILIDKGSLAGIEKNMPVIVFENILVGKITEVFNDFSKVLLIVSANSKIPVLIQESRVEGLIEGVKENILFMDLVPKDAKVKKGQTVITSSINPVFPKGLLIGEILTVEFSENEMFQKITVKPAINMEELERVFIVKNF